ncbi:LOW QUALITY PROTEIN: cadherin-16 [Cyanocitta cristata]
MTQRYHGKYSTGLSQKPPKFFLASLLPQDLAATGSNRSRVDYSSVLDTSRVSNCHLIVQVKDLGNQSPGNCALATLEIAITENTRVPFSFQEVHYSLKGAPSGLFFSVDSAGNIYVAPERVSDREIRQSSVFLFAGSEIIPVKAENINDSNTNRLIAYGILSQKPQVSNGFSLNTGRDI